MLDFTLQPKYELIPKFSHNGKTVRALTYIADFLVTYSDGREEIVDVKGVLTKEFLLKKKLFHYFYPDLELKLYSKYVKGVWVTVEEESQTMKKVNPRGSRSAKRRTKRISK